MGCGSSITQAEVNAVVESAGGSVVLSASFDCNNGSPNIVEGQGGVLYVAVASKGVGMILEVQPWKTVREATPLVSYNQTRT